MRAYPILACVRVSPSERNHRRLSFLRTSANSFPDVLSSSVETYFTSDNSIPCCGACPIKTYGFHVRPHLNTSLPHAPSDQFRTGTAFLLVCDQVGLVLGRYVQVLLPDFVVGFHALSPRVASRTPTLFLCTSACCFHVSRVDSIAVATAARCAWSVLLPAVDYVFCSWVLGSLPLAVSFLLISRCRCHFDSTE